MLLGIILSFLRLSPSLRQVTHVLLTRSPLIHLFSFRRNQMSFIVRLACVMHAASVYPEPGSNSHENLYESFWFKLFHLHWFSSMRDFFLKSTWFKLFNLWLIIFFYNHWYYVLGYLFDIRFFAVLWEPTFIVYYYFVCLSNLFCVFLQKFYLAYKFL